MTRAGWPAGALAGIAVALVAGLALHLVGSVDPVNEMLSNGIRTPVGAVLLAVACLGLVGTAGFLAVPWHRSPWRLTLLGGWAAGLLAVALCPTNLPGETATASGQFHRYGAVVTVVVPLLLGLSLRDRQLRRITRLTAGLAAVYGATQGPVALFGATSIPYAGSTERAVLAMLLVVLVLTVRVLRDTAPRGTETPYRRVTPGVRRTDAPDGLPRSRFGSWI